MDATNQPTDIKEKAQAFCKAELAEIKESQNFSQEIVEAILAKIIRIEDAAERQATFTLWSSLPGAVGNASQFRQFLVKQGLLTATEKGSKRGISLASLGL